MVHTTWLPAEECNHLARAAPALGPGPPPVPGVAAPVAGVRSVAGSPVAAPAAGPGPAPLVAAAPAAPAATTTTISATVISTVSSTSASCGSSSVNGDPQVSSIVGTPVQSVHGILGVSLVIIADKSKPTASPRFSLNRKVNVANVSILLE